MKTTLIVLALATAILLGLQSAADSARPTGERVGRVAVLASGG